MIRDVRSIFRAIVAGVGCMLNLAFCSGAMELPTTPVGMCFTDDGKPAAIRITRPDGGDMAITYACIRMKWCLVGCLAAGIAGAASPLTADTLYWNGNHTAAGANPSTATGGGGSGEWYGSNWWNGRTSVTFDGRSKVVFAGSGGLVDCPTANVPGVLFRTNGYTVHLTKGVFNLVEPGSLNVADGVTARIDGTPDGTNGIFRKDEGAGTLIMADRGEKLPFSYTGVNDFMTGTVIVKNDPAGKGIAAYYTNLRGATLRGTGRVTDGPMDVNGGVIAPGNSGDEVATLWNTGPVSMCSEKATLVVKIGSNGNDMLCVTDGAVVFKAGIKLRLVLLNGITPTEGQTFDIIRAKDGIKFGDGITLRNVKFDVSKAPLRNDMVWKATVVDLGRDGKVLRMVAGQRELPTSGAVTQR